MSFFPWKKITLISISRLKIEGDGDLVIQDVRDDDEGKYQCMAKNLVGTRSTDKVDLSIQGNYFQTHNPEDKSNH